MMCWFAWAIIIGNKCDINRSLEVGQSYRYGVPTDRFIYIKEIEIFMVNVN